MPALIEGKPIYIKGSGAKPYELKNVGGVFSCSCPAWRNQSFPIDQRTCKHLRAHCGDAAEEARIAGQPTPANDTKPMTAAPDDAQRILERAAAQGRNLRQDEKVKLNGPPILLAHKFDDVNPNPTGWWMSEKLDGVRAYWDGKNFLSRAGNVFNAPPWFKEGLPSHSLDGELWMGRRLFEQTSGLCRRHNGGDEWRKVAYLCFDMPHLKSPFEERLIELISVLDGHQYARAHHHKKCESLEHLVRELYDIEKGGGEGLMIRKPRSLYVAGRSDTLLKVKPFKDDEGIVIGYKPGKGRHKGRLGALQVRMKNGIEFDVGTGFSDKERGKLPPRGATITFRYCDVTSSGKPKCASFVCVRDYE